MSIATNNCCPNNCKDKKFNHIIEMLGPVLFGAKPAEIVNFPRGDEMAKNRKELIKETVKGCRKLEYLEFDTIHGCSKLLFFNHALLEKTLLDVEKMKFLQSLNYPQEYDLNKYLEQLISKMKDGEMPHEIGIFLGYPLKDVKGFMGYSSHQLTKVKGWKVYGDPAQSDELYSRITEARHRIKELLKVKEPETIMAAV